WSSDVCSSDLARNFVEDCLDERRLIDFANRRTDDECQASESIVVFLFDELIIERTAAKSRWKHILHDPKHRTSDKRHSLACQLSKTENVANVIRKSGSLHWTPAITLVENPVVVELDVE